MRIAALFIVFSALAVPALAQSSDQVDPNGAIRAMGSTGAGHRRHRHHDSGIEIPRFVHPVRRAADQLPPGTTRPGSSRTFVAPR